MHMRHDAVVTRWTTVLVLSLAAVAGCKSSSHDESTPVLAATPPMGFNDWNSFGCNVSADVIKQAADKMVELGLRDAGYLYVNIDDCWQVPASATDYASVQATRDPGTGRLVPNPETFPPSAAGKQDGIKQLADYIHSKGMKIGIYSSAGYATCQSKYAASYGHEDVDAQTFADWGIDYLKYDNCGTTDDMKRDRQAYVDRYKAMSDALKKTQRDIVYSLCEWGEQNPWEWGGAIGQLWRTTGDISDSYSSMLGIMKQNAVLTQYARPGAWNDPDMLEVGNGGMSDTEYRSHFSLWSMMNAPLIIGANLANVSAGDATVKILANKDVIAVNQDPLGKQATLLAGAVLGSTDASTSYVFAKPLASGDVAVALFNASDTGAMIATTPEDIVAKVAEASGFAGGMAYVLTDLWSDTKEQTWTARVIRGYAPAHGTVMYRVTKSAHVPTDLLPNVTLAISNSSTVIYRDGTGTVSVSVTNNSDEDITPTALELTLPPGWTAAPVTLPSAFLPTATTTVSFTVTPPASSVIIEDVPATATLTFKAAGMAGSVSVNATYHVAARVQASWMTVDATTENSAVFGQSSTGNTFEILAAGIGVSTAKHFGTFFNQDAMDQYAAISKPGLFDSGANTASVIVTAVPTSVGGFFSTHQTGLLVRNSMTAATASGEVAVYLDASGDVNVAWNGASALGPVDSSASTAVGFGPFGTHLGAKPPVKLTLVRSGTTFRVYYSTTTDGGTTWTEAELAVPGGITVPTAATAQDVGMFHAGGATGALNKGQLQDLEVAP